MWIRSICCNVDQRGGWLCTCGSGDGEEGAPCTRDKGWGQGQGLEGGVVQKVPTAPCK